MDHGSEFGGRGLAEDPGLITHVLPLVLVLRRLPLRIRNRSMLGRAGNGKPSVAEWVLDNTTRHALEHGTRTFFVNP